tara:strand:+ start:2780 stop:3019 length:240 start_codon:yes stop_codon:yes gene_type:complete
MTNEMRHTDYAIDAIGWTEIPCENVRRYQFGDYPEIIYIVKTGFKNKYMILHEDAYQLHIGKTSIMTKEEIEKTYNIIL